MPLQIEPSIVNQLPAMVKEALSKMPEEKQSMFVEEYKKKSKSTGLMVVLAIFFPIQLFLLGKTGLGIAYWLTGAGCGLWWLIEIFLTAGRVRAFNDDVASSVMRDLKIMS